MPNADDDTIAAQLAAELEAYNKVLASPKPPLSGPRGPRGPLIQPVRAFYPAANLTARPNALFPEKPAGPHSVVPKPRYRVGHIAKGSREAVNMPINWWWSALLEQNEVAPPKFKRTDEELTKEMLRKFPGRHESVLMWRAHRWRATYNRGQLPCQGGTPPARPSLKYARLSTTADPSVTELYVIGRKGRVLARVLEDGSYEYYGPAKWRSYLHVRTRASIKRNEIRNSKMEARAKLNAQRVAEEALLKKEHKYL